MAIPFIKKKLALEQRVTELENRVNPTNYGLGGSCKTVTGDLDNCCGNATGFYQGVNLVNAPNDNKNWWFIIQLCNTGNWIKQIATSFNSSSLYMRTKQNGVWGDWTQI